MSIVSVCVVCVCTLITTAPLITLRAIPNSHYVAYSSHQQRAVATHPPISTTGTPSHTTPIPVAGEFSSNDVIRQLDLAADENDRLRGTLKENNLILEAKVLEIQKCLETRDRERQELQARVGQLEGRLREEERKRQSLEKTQREEAVQRKSMPATVSDITGERLYTTHSLTQLHVAN